MKSNVMKYIQLVMMAVIAVAGVVMVIHHIREGIGSFDDVLSLFFHVVEIAALIMGCVYVRDGYSKSGALFFKLQLFFMLELFLLRVVKSVLHGDSMPMILNTVMIVLLFVLLFFKDLGEVRSWILFAFIVALEVIIMIPSFRSGIPGRIVDDVLILLILANLGLMIKGKYDDKRSRAA